MPECPDCETKFQGKACPKCGWTRIPSGDGQRWVWKTECEWITNGQRCLIRPSAALDGGKQHCSWHHAVALMGSPRVASHFESYEAYVIDLEDRRVCTMETHYPARITFAWVCGEPVSAKATPCAHDGCAVRRRDEEAAPMEPLTSNQSRVAITKIQEQLGVGMSATQRALPPIDPAIREKLR